MWWLFKTRLISWRVFNWKAFYSNIIWILLFYNYILILPLFFNKVIYIESILNLHQPSLFPHNPALPCVNSKDKGSVKNCLAIALLTLKATTHTHTHLQVLHPPDCLTFQGNVQSPACSWRCPAFGTFRNFLFGSVWLSRCFLNLRCPWHAPLSRLVEMHGKDTERGMCLSLSVKPGAERRTWNTTDEVSSAWVSVHRTEPSSSSTQDSV